MISYMSWKQKIVALSTIEVEYIATRIARCEVVLLRKLFGELFEQVLNNKVIYCDNNSGISLEENIMFHEKSRNIETISLHSRHGVERCC